eukprot:Nk52_evm7s1992 gene=Nk52_evmTU7s1992
MSLTVEEQAMLKANKADKATQELRWKALKGKKIVFVTAPFAQTTAAYETAHKMGCEIYLLGTEGHAFCDKIVDLGITAGRLMADITDEKNCFENSLKAIKDCGIEFDGVFTFYEATIPLVCELSDALELPGNTAAAANNCRDKNVAREICEKAGINGPKHFHVATEADIEEAAAYVGFPAVLKPSSGAGSVGVVRVNNMEEMVKGFNEIVEDLKENIFLTWNPGCDVKIMVESYLDGDEFDVDILMWDSEAVFSSCSDNWATHEPYFLETGSSCPSFYSAEKQKEIIDYSIACCKALGFTQGCFHVELKYTTTQGPMLIEVNPRMGGGVVREFNQWVFGVDLFENFLLSAAGIPINPPQADKPLTYVSHYALNPPVSGTVENVDFLNFIKENSHVKWARVFPKTGDKIKGVDQGLPEWIGEFCLEGESTEASAALVRELESQIVYPIKPIVDEVTEKVAEVSIEAGDVQQTVG